MIQSIGARYVPKFYDYNGSSDWRSGVEYEALTIVTFAGNSFTSKKPVPASVGSPNLNPTYWANTGNMNAQVEEYRREASEALALSQQNAEDIQTITGGVSLNLPEKAPTNPNRKWIILGDSYGVTQGGATGLVQQLRAIMGLNSSNSWTMAENSARFGSNHPVGAHSYLELLQMYNSSINPDDISDIVVCTAGNDIDEQTEDMNNAIDAFAAYCKTHFINANIFVAYTYFAQYHTSRVKKYNCMVAMRDHVVTVDNMTWLNNIDIACKDYSLARNTTHPNSAGLRLFAEAISTALLAGAASIAFPHAKRAAISINSSNQPIETAGLESDVDRYSSEDLNFEVQNFQVNDNIIMRTTHNTQFVLKNPITINAPSSYGGNYAWSASFDLGKLDYNRFFGEPITAIFFNVPNCALRFSSYLGHSNVWVNCDSAFIRFTERDVVIGNTHYYETHPILTVYMNNPGGPDTGHAAVIANVVKFGYADWEAPADYV